MGIFIGNLAYSIIEILIVVNYKKKVRRFKILSCIFCVFENSFSKKSKIAVLVSDSAHKFPQIIIITFFK